MTVVEVQTKLAQLEAERDTALAAAKVLTPATPEFDDAYGRYLASKTAIGKIPDELAKAKLSENADAIKAQALVVGETLVKLTTGLKVAELLGSPLTSLRALFTETDVEGVKVTTCNVAFNPPVAASKPVKAKAEGAAEAKELHKRTVIMAPGGAKYNPTKFILTFMPQEEQAKEQAEATAKGNKAWYPHVLVDSLPKFEAFCKAHNLVGYTYDRGES